MIRIRPLCLLLLGGLMTARAESDRLVLPGGSGPGQGKHIVLISGDEEYRSEEALPMLVKILSRHHGFDCTVLFAWSADGTHIDPNNQAGIRGWDALDRADLLIIATRFRNPSPEQAAHLTAYLNAGKPVIGLRTATHAFRGNAAFGAIGYNEWGRKILGEQWVNHHGKHKVEGARGVIEPGREDHPVLRGVQDVFGPSDVYGVIHLTEADTILMRGMVTRTLDPASEPVPEKNQPMQALAWLHPYTGPDGQATGAAFCTTMGASVDLVSEDLRRLVVNAAYHLTGLEVPARAVVDYVDPYYPSFYGFIRDASFWPKQDLQPEDFGLGKTTRLPDPPGSPAWPHRPRP